MNDELIRAEVPIPPASPEVYRNGIVHKALWLWDSWTCRTEYTQHLYCLALSRTTVSGQPVLPDDRNNYPFHFRHFESNDEGATWRDLGACLTPATDADSYYGHNIWSGSVLQLESGEALMGFTGMRKISNARPFLQSIGIAWSDDGHTVKRVQSEPISCPLRDYDQIVEAGYFLGPKSDLGHKDGEAGGPILAWRDPYLFNDQQGKLNCVWSAKADPTTGAIAHAELEISSSGEVRITTLAPPIILPESHEITQAEVPKIVYNRVNKEYLCLVSACDRVHEAQKVDEISKTLKLYRSASIHGPWQAYMPSGSTLTGFDDLFGASILNADFEAGQLTLIAPFTEAATPSKQLTFAPVKKLEIDRQTLLRVLSV